MSYTRLPLKETRSKPSRDTNKPTTNLFLNIFQLARPAKPPSASPASPLGAGLVLEGVGAARGVPDEGLALGGALLLCGGASEGHGLGLGDEALLLLAVLAAGPGESGDADDDGAGKDERHDDAGRVHAHELHADVLVGRVDGADERRGAGRGGDGGGHAGVGDDVLAAGGDIARRRRLLAAGEAARARHDASGLGIRGGGSRIGRGGRVGTGDDLSGSGSGLEAALELARGGQVAAALERLLRLLPSLVGGAAGVDVAGADVVLVEGRELLEAAGEGALVAAVGVGGHVVGVFDEAVEVRFVGGGGGHGHGGAREEDG